MSVIWRFLFLSLFALLCAGYNITVPSSNITAGELKAFPWSWTAADSQLSTSGMFVVILVNCTKEFECPTQPNNPGVGLMSILKIIEDSVTAKNPTNGSEASGKLFLTPSHPGDHMICTYGNLSSDGFSHDRSKFNSNFGESIASLKFVDQSKTFNVIQDTQPNSTAMTPPTNSTDGGGGWGHGRNPHGDDGDKNQVPIGAIVGAVVGGVVLVILLLLVFFYRKRFTQQRKVNQFHRERMLFHQQPPPSFVSSAGASTVLPQVMTQAIATAHPLSPKRPSDITAGFEDTTRKNYPYLVHPDDHSDSHYSPSTCSAALPNVEPTPVFRAQHAAPQMGTQEV